MLNFSSGFPSIFTQLRTAGVFGYGKKKVKSIHILLSDLRKIVVHDCMCVPQHGVC